MKKAPDIPTADLLELMDWDRRYYEQHPYAPPEPEISHNHVYLSEQQINAYNNTNWSDIRR